MPDVTVEGTSVLCKDGKHHPLLRMPNYDATRSLRRSDKLLTFRVFVRRNNEPPKSVDNWMKGEHTGKAR